MYSRITNLVFGFHGCDERVGLKVLRSKGTIHLEKSNNDYDWLGNGIYFWENSKERARDFALTAKKNPHLTQGVIRKPFVIGAIIDLGHCLNLLDSRFLKELRAAYDFMLKADYKLPENEKPDKAGKFLKRNLDCAVIRALHSLREENNLKPFDSVRGVFVEGKELYPTAGFNEKNHIQICIRNPNCIKGYFHPQEIMNSHQIP